MTSPNITDTVLVPLADGTSMGLLGDNGAVRLLIGSEPALGWSEWEQLNEAATRLYAGQRGRKAAELAASDGMADDFAGLVAATFSFPDKAAVPGDMTDAEWANVARLLREHPAWRGGLLEAYWDRAGKALSDG